MNLSKDLKDIKNLAMIKFCSKYISHYFKFNPIFAPDLQNQGLEIILRAF